ncbi:hypothetical protein [Paenibacillus sp. UNC496MF]|uniref:hypothetical protein n=1 Tax=Paenibacillus sp. UNC496MF TaxID=1502753 RepID=UPI001160942F|nr:hypothetical protein [Paenibacillus sp. UNC496MF]
MALAIGIPRRREGAVFGDGDPNVLQLLGRPAEAHDMRLTGNIHDRYARASERFNAGRLGAQNGLTNYGIFAAENERLEGRRRPPAGIHDLRVILDDDRGPDAFRAKKRASDAVQGSRAAAGHGEVPALPVLHIRFLLPAAIQATQCPAPH